MQSIDFSGVEITRDQIAREYDTTLREYGIRVKLMEESKCKLFRLKAELAEFDKRMLEQCQ